MSLPICSACNGPIEEVVLNAFGMAWHPEHLVCNTCGKDFGDGSRCEEGADGFAYCSQHYLEAFAPKCGGCNQPIVGTVINAMNRSWHPEHFVCATCKQSLSNSFFHGEDMIPYCEKHYYQSMNLLCAACEKPIVTGRLVSMGDKRYHPEHFTCTFCKRNLAGAGYKTVTGKPYCKDCHLKLFG
eukprot:TRINITY_DN1118_c0_g1_i1.p1 TRINITY_DN1118_c0_g1~~TRINITY_DN1118_c0_g1_i1.p1  ORF type:complete len:184 (+),score=22.28 TRINITY_DN1118_c0_g1_i1:294-845(+)